MFQVVSNCPKHPVRLIVPAASLRQSSKSIYLKKKDGKKNKNTISARGSMSIICTKSKV